MESFELSPDEARLARKMGEGEVCDLGGADGRSRSSVSAEALRRLLLGLDVRFPGQTENEAVVVAGPGLQLKNAVITGTLRLEDATSLNGDACPPLVLEACTIAGTIYLTRGRFRHLSLQGSKITYLCARELVVEGSLDISGLCSAETESARTGADGEGRCQVDLRGAKIAGSVNGTDSVFVAERRDAKDPAKLRYALDVSSARIQGRVRLDRVCAKGVINISASEFGGDVYAAGLRVKSEDDGQSSAPSHIDMSDSKTCPFAASGDLLVYSSKIGGSLDLPKSSIDGWLVGSNITVRFDVILSDLEAKGILLPGAHISKVLTISGGRLLEEVDDYSIKINNSEIGMDAILGDWGHDEFLTVKKSISLRDARIGGALRIGILKAGSFDKVEFDLENTAVVTLDDGLGAGFPDAMTLRLEGFSYSKLDRPSGGVKQRDQSYVRLNWLKKQFPNRVFDKYRYSPDPYERLAKYFRSQGFYNDARHVASERISLERDHIIFKPFAPFLRAFQLLFDYGLSPRRAIITFLVLIAVGACGTYIADRQPFSPRGSPPVLVITTSTVNSVAIRGREGYVPALADSEGSEQQSLPCLGEIDPPLYAIDVFVPGINLDQNVRCSVTSRADAGLWRFAKAFYTIIGWIITPLTVLTVSGILRRQIET